MVDSPHHPEQEVIFALGEAGVIDPDSDTKKKTTMTPKPSKLEPDTKPSKLEPDTKPSKLEPDTKPSKLEPDTKSVDTPKTDVDLENKTEDKAENTE
jgi:DNA repair protein RadA